MQGGFRLELKVAFLTDCSFCGKNICSRLLAWVKRAWLKDTGS